MYGQPGIEALRRARRDRGGPGLVREVLRIPAHAWPRVFSTVVSACVDRLRAAAQAGGPSELDHLEEIRRAMLRHSSHTTRRRAQIEDTVRLLRVQLDPLHADDVHVAFAPGRTGLPEVSTRQLLLDLLEVDHALHLAVRRPATAGAA